MKKFNFSDKNLNNLNQNGQHQFAMRHAMHVYGSNVVYSFIPKNGCSTLRLSVAMANGCISDISDGHWIHANNGTFTPGLRDAIIADYAFVVLRCPFRRLASVYLDKFVSKEPEAWLYRNQLNRSVELDDLTFEQFVKSLAVPPMKGFNIHWKPQSDFLLYSQYDDYFALEHFDNAITTLKQKINFDVVDARSLTGHGTDKFDMLNDRCFATTAAFDIATLKRQGQCPSHQAMYNDELIALVQRLYADDIKLYSDKCDAADLLFR